MGQITTGVRSFLSSPLVYQSFQDLIHRKHARRDLAQRYIRSKPGDKVLDIGCGTGEILQHLPNVEYFGFDPNPRYIEYARKTFKTNGNFTCAGVTQQSLENLPKFDIVLTLAVLHHLNDDEAIHLFELARRAMNDQGRLVTLDGVYVENQPFMEKYMLDHDRGQNVRTAEGYAALARRIFSRVEWEIQSNIYRIPYRIIFMNCHP